MNKYLKTLLPLLVLVVLLLAQRYLNQDQTPSFSPAKEETLLPEESAGEQAPSSTGGDMSDAPVVQDMEGTLLIEHEGFSLLFDTRTLCPRWVAWELTAGETRGKVSREGINFMEDEKVPKPYQVTSYDYNGGHYGRGHMCPAGDMKWSQQAMQDCHYMTNICPQTAELNKNWWEHLERACRRWARQEGSVQIVCGPIFPAQPKLFGKRHKISVPEAFFKVVLSLKEGEEKALGFYYTNDDSPQQMEDAVRSVDEIEQMTGIDFFSNLPDAQEDRLEAMTDLNAWGK